MKITDCCKKWDEFFFDERPTEGMGVFRIVWTSLLFIYFLLDLGNLKEFYGPHALISLQTAKDQFPNFHMNVFHLLNQSYEVVFAIIFVYGLALISMLLGFYTRTSIFVVLVCMVSFHQRNIWLLSSVEVLMRTITLLMLFSACGHSLSIDSWLGRRYRIFKKEKYWSPWVWRLIQIQVSVIYLWTVWHKLKGEDWVDGTAVYYATRLESMTNFTLPYFLDSPLFLKLATWGTLILELSLGVLVWFKETRKIVIVAGVIFHLGIEYTMSIPYFEWYMLALLMLYFTPEEHKHFVEKTKMFIQKIRIPMIKFNGEQNEAV